MSVNIPSNSGVFYPKEYSESRPFLTDLQTWLESQTWAIFKERYIQEFGQEKWERDFKSKSVTPNEPEDLYTLSQNQPQTYFEILKKVTEFWDTTFQESIKIAYELGGKNPEESMRIYYSALAKVYAENFKKTSKIAEEKLADMIQKELMRQAPYYQAAFSMLINAKQGITLRSLGNTIKQAVERIVWPDNKKWAVTTVDFRKGKVLETQPGKDPIVEEKEQENPEFEKRFNQMTELLRDKVDARRYIDILLMPINAHSTIKERTLIQIHRNPGFESLTQIFKELTKEYDSNPERVLSLGYIDFFRFLGNLTAIASTAEVLDGYEKKMKQYSLVILCERVIRELTEAYFLKHTGKQFTSDELRERMGMIIGSWDTVDILSGRKKWLTPEEMQIKEVEEYEIFNSAEVLRALPWLQDIGENTWEIVNIWKGLTYELILTKNISEETIVSLVDEMFKTRQQEPNSIFIIMIAKELPQDKKTLFQEYLLQKIVLMSQTSNDNKKE